MLTVAYLANRFPSSVEPYVADEIQELRQHGVRVITGSVRRAGPENGSSELQPDVVLQGLRAAVLLRAIGLCFLRWRRILPLIVRILFQGREGPVQRVKALTHTLLGACYAVLLEEHKVEHIHVHHGYFGSWIALTAARLLNVGYSLTLHGSDLLVRASYLDVKLAYCTCCATISEYNRRYILEHYPEVDAEKIVVSRLGVEVSERRVVCPPQTRGQRFTMLAVGRLHAVKDHAFLVRACAELHTRGIDFECLIAGEGPERRRLESLIRRCGLEHHVTLLGHVEREQMPSLYDRADVVVLTSRSEGIPLVLMEAMARSRIVLAPSITGIPELVVHAKTGFLYDPGSMGDLVARLLFIRALMETASGPRCHPYIVSAARQLDWMRHAAQLQVRHNFHRAKNLEAFCEFFLGRIASSERAVHEDSVLQQIQPSLQRHRGLPVRTDAAHALAGARSGIVFDD